MASFRSLAQLLCVTLVVLAVISEAAKPKSKKRARPTRPKRPVRRNNAGGCSADSDIAKNISALWTHMNILTQPIEVHVHDTDPSMDGCDDYFGCGSHAGHGHHGHHGHGSHGHGAHGSHGHGAHGSHGRGHGHGKMEGHGGHKHGSHGHHGSHAHGSHGHHGSHHQGHKDNHIHIHLSVNEKKDCGFVSYRPKDEFVYARCDMVTDGRPKVKGSILMRQKPHQAIETKINLNGFRGASQGTKDGKHDFFFDIHKMADFSNGCASFGAHDHVHGPVDHHANENKGTPSPSASAAVAAHDHSHPDHVHDDTDDHEHHIHHGHGVHDHHVNADDWGNVIVDNKGVVSMEVNTTIYELFGPESVLGRGIMLHDKDDKPVSCCAITYANLDDEAWDKL